MAQRDRVFVASYGSDNNPCTYGSPCKTFQNAVNVVATGGEVTAIDSGGFQPVTITNKSVIITSPAGVEAGIVTAPGNNAITINGGPNDTVTLQGLTLDGPGALGILFNTGASLKVQNCVIRGFVFGIEFLPNDGTTNGLFVSDTLIADAGAGGIDIQLSSNVQVTTVAINRVQIYNTAVGFASTGTPANITITDTVISSGLDVETTGIFIGSSGSTTIDHATVSGMQTGIVVDGTNASHIPTMNVTIRNSVVSNNIGNGITVESTSSVIPEVMVRNSEFSNNQNGLSSNPGGVILLGESGVTGNSATGALLNGGTFYTYGDNNIDLNTPDVGGGSLSPLTTK